MNRFEFLVEEIPIYLPTASDLVDLYEAAEDEPIALKLAMFLPTVSPDWTEKVLRGAIDRGELPAQKIGRRIYVTKRGIAEWRDRSAVRPKDRNSAPDFQKSDPKAAASRAAAMSALAALKVKR